MSPTIEIVQEKFTIEFVGAGGEFSIEFVEQQIAVLEFVAQGPQGASAYGIALQNGFVGTEEEWLDSLKADEFNEDLILIYQTSKL